MNRYRAAVVLLSDGGVASAAKQWISSNGLKNVVKVKQAARKVSRAESSSSRKPRSTSRNADNSARSGASIMAARRNLVVFLSLVGLLSFTSILLLALSPAPLSPSAPSSLFALDAPQSMDEVFQTSAPVDGARWRYIFVHHSRTPGGNAALLAQPGIGSADHFVIGNGDGAIDGEIQITRRWSDQFPAAPVQGLERIGPDCVSICLVGNFDEAEPTPTQSLRLNQLVSALQRRLRIPAGHVLLLDSNSAPAGAGRRFPATAFRSQLLP